jgi:ParB-like chromosome segregation protein Spo0J
MEILDELPPVVLFKLDGELIIADGFHREAAAERLGRSEIEAEIRPGTREEALEYAIRANVNHGKALTREEYKEAVRRLKRLHPDWGYGRISGVINRSEEFVSIILRADEVRRGVVITTPVEDSKLDVIRSAEHPHWEPLVERAKTWSTNELRAAVREIKDEATPVERRRALLEGKTEPTVSKAGEPAFLKETVERRIAEGIAGDKVVALTGAWSSLGKLEQFNPKEVVDSLDNFHLERVVKDTPRDIDYLTQLVKFARQRLELWEEVDK